MRKIIRGRMYNTETAQRIGSWDNGMSGGDLEYTSETLYRKRTGEFFLDGCGGARSRYAEVDGNMMAPGNRIVPMTFDQAREWAEEHLTPEKYESAFGAVDADAGKQYFNCGLEAPVMKLLKTAAARDERSMGDIIAQLIVEKYG